MSKLKCRIGMFPFESYFVYKPVLHKKENRYMTAMIHRIDGSTFNTSYARYLYQVHHKVILEKEIRVDHIDGDRTHDIITNYQLLTVSENNTKAKIELGLRTSSIYYLKCPNCEKLFEKTHRLMYNKKAGFCSRQCSGQFYFKFSGEEQERRISQNIIRIEEKQKIIIDAKHIIENWENYTLELPESLIKIPTRIVKEKLVRPTTEDLINYKNNGVSNIEIAKIYNLSETAVRKWYKKLLVSS